MASELDEAIAKLRKEAERHKHGSRRADSMAKVGGSELFEDAAHAVAVEVRRMHDLSGDIDRELNKLRWRGESATYFRRHAGHQRVRVEQNIEVMESLRVLLLQAAEAARQAHRTAGVP